MELRKKAVSISIKEIDDETRSFWAVASDETVDRDGDVIKADGWDVTNFLKNPVIPWGHDYHQPPVARAEQVKIEDGKLMIKARFASADDYPFADTIYRLYKGGFLRAFSVGFKPIEWKEVDQDGRRGWDIEKAELYEVSAVTVPANPNALARAVEKGVISEEEKKALDITPAKEVIKEINSADLIHQLKTLTDRIDALEAAVKELAPLKGLIQDIHETITLTVEAAHVQPEPDSKEMAATVADAVTRRIKQTLADHINSTIAPGV